MNDNQEKSPARARFPVGAAVRVKFGTMDPDFSDIPIGGWAGTIQESDPPMYLVKWHQFILDQNPSYSERCKRDGLELETMWLDDNDLELDSGAITRIEHPSAFIRRPLSPEIRGDEASPVYDYVQGLPFNIPSFFPKKRLSFRAAVIVVLFWGTLLGIVVGSLIGSMEIAGILAASGAAVLGILGLIAGSKLGMIFGRLNLFRSGLLWGGILGATGGGIVGAFFGAVTVAIVGVTTGSLLGALLSNLVLGGRKKASFIFLGAMLGATVQAFLLNREQALVGALYGGAFGAGTAFVALFGWRCLTASYRKK